MQFYIFLRFKLFYLLRDGLNPNYSANYDSYLSVIRRYLICLPTHPHYSFCLSSWTIYLWVLRWYLWYLYKWCHVLGRLRIGWLAIQISLCFFIIWSQLDKCYMSLISCPRLIRSLFLFSTLNNFHRLQYCYQFLGLFIEPDGFPWKIFSISKARLLIFNLKS